MCYEFETQSDLEEFETQEAKREYEAYLRLKDKYENEEE